MGFKYKFGDFVVCIEDRVTPLKRGNIYIIRGFNGPDDLRLEGVSASWHKRRFLPANLTPLEKVIYGLS